LDRVDALIKLDQIAKRYGQVRALEDVTLSIGAGVTGLLGPNGAGKTTLIKVLLGLVRATRGSGQVFGHDLQAQTRSIRAKLGYMPEDDFYVAGLSGVEMVRFSARLSGLPSVEALRRAHETLDFCGLEQERYREVDTYSMGMRQKVKFAQAIVHDPPLLVLDEPTSGLDPSERSALLQRVRVLASRAGKSVILSTHILPDVQAICDTVVILSRGRVRVVERLDVLSRPASPTFHLQTVGPADALAERLRREGLGVRQSEDGALTLTEADENTVPRVWDWAREVGVAIRRFVPAQNSLERIFLEAVGEGGSADS
jgi:ABC-2 type transport system ATP-binding protein